MTFFTGVSLVLGGIVIGAFLGSRAAHAGLNRERIELAEGLLHLLAQVATVLEDVGMPASDIAVLRAREETLRSIIDQVKKR